MRPAMVAPSTVPAVLIVDDDTELAALLVRLLQGEGWTATTAASGAEGTLALARDEPDVLLLDVLLPDANGMDLCRRWRAEQPALGILMLTARGDPFDRVLGLELGADDDLAKPFEKRELVARLRALIRRRRPVSSAPATHWSFDSLTVHLIRREVLAHGRVIPLTSIEFKLLVELARTPGQAVTRQQLSDAVQATAYRPLDRTVDVQVGRLRKKLEADAQAPLILKSVRGVGYLLAVPVTAAAQGSPQ